jgi:hypothetical protein
MIRNLPGACALMLFALLGLGCEGRDRPVTPSIEFTTVPEAAEGGSGKRVRIAGRVTGARPGQHVVLYAKSNLWWLQPLTTEPFTKLAADSTWENSIHLGTEYAALLVNDGFRPPPTTERLPAAGGAVVAIATTSGTGQYTRPPGRILAFSGYEWEIRQVPSDRGGNNAYHGSNAWTDAEGFLHLRLAKRDDDWTSAEVFLTRSLGYGTYVFTVRDTSSLDPAAAFGMITWDNAGEDQNHRELNIEISQWGDRSLPNAQYVLQPYYVPANVARFSAPTGTLTHSFRWEPGRAAFRTTRGRYSPAAGRLVKQHEFTSGVPSPGTERVRMHLYYFRYSSEPPQRDVEVVIERFQYLP